MICFFHHRVQAVLRYLRQVPDLSTQRWRIKLWAYILGCLAALALAPLYIFPCLIVAFSGLLYLTQSSHARSAFWLGWWFGFGYFTVGLYWIAFALGVDLTRFGWMIPFSVFGLPALLAFFIAPILAVTQASGTKGLNRLIVFALLWTVFEWLRGHLFTGFPWNLIGYSCINFLSVAQIFSLVGAYGVSFFVILWSGSLFLWPHYRTMLWVYSTFIFAFVYGIVTMTNPIDVVPNLTLRIVQPSIAQKLKASPQHAEENLQKIIKLTNTPPQGSVPNIYIWPESATAYFLANDHKRRHLIMQHLNSPQLLLTGVTRILKQRDVRLWNSLIAIDSQGKTVAHYDKSHLVPFGEYLPLRSILSSFMKKLTPGSIDYSPGHGLKTLEVFDLPPFSPLICYEVIFPGKVKAQSENIKPQWILNITNDAWYGNTSGPYQHLAIAQARAIEEGLPLIRVGNNGISAVIDPYGRLIKTLALNQVGILDACLPKARPTSTLYGHYGDKMLCLLLMISIGFLILKELWSRKIRYDSNR